MSRDWLAPLTGIAFLALLIAGFAVSGEPPDAGDPVQEIVGHYVDNKDSIFAGALMLGLATVFLIFFANHLRSVLRDAPTSPVILVGAGIVAVGAGIDATILVALSESAEDIDPTAVQALQALWDNDFVPIAIGIITFLVSAGISILRSGALPRWLGWVALVIALAAMTPAGFFAFIATAIFIVVLSVMLLVRARRAGPPPASATPPPTQ